MVEITGYAWEQITVWLLTLTWTTVLLGVCVRFVYVGFTRYPWPEWARPRRRSREAAA